jgi:hypothetical protein
LYLRPTLIILQVRQDRGRWLETNESEIINEISNVK